MKFNTESSLFEFLGTFTDFVGLNLIFLITCIPIITIGPALSALYTVTLREARGEHGYFISTYLKAFKANIKNGIILFLIYLLAGAVLLFNLIFWYNSGSTPGNIIFIILAVISVCYVISIFYVFALNARYENSIKQTIYNAFFLPFSSPLFTLLIVAIPATALLLAWLTPVLRVILLLFGAAFITYCESF